MAAYEFELEGLVDFCNLFFGDPEYFSQRFNRLFDKIRQKKLAFFLPLLSHFLGLQGGVRGFLGSNVLQALLIDP